MFNTSRFFFASLLAVGLSVPLVVQAAPASLFDSPAPSPNGLDALLRGLKLYSGQIGGGSTLSGADLIRYERTNVGRNREALKKIREGLELPVQMPALEKRDDDTIDYKDVLRLGHLLKQEADVRFADANYAGAINSKLDCIQLGVVLTRGGTLPAVFAGLDVESMGRENFEKFVGKLTAGEMTAAAARLDKIETLRPPFSDGFRFEKKFAVGETKDALENQDWVQVIGAKEKPNGETFTEAEKETLTNAGQEEIMSNLNKGLDAIIVAADAPYRAAKLTYSKGADPWSKMMIDSVTNPTYRISYELARAENQLIKIALQLQAVKVQTRQYPETIELPEDPFSTSPGGKLKYSREGESFKLYSVGPNGKDDNGAALAPGDEGLTVTTPGDLIAPVFPE